jgi:hypothetical protein
MHEIRQQGAMREGRSTLAELHATIAVRPGELEGVRALLERPPIPPANEFDDGITTVLVGIAVRRQEDPTDLLMRAAHSNQALDERDDAPRDGSLSA